MCGVRVTHDGDQGGFQPQLAPGTSLADGAGRVGPRVPGRQVELPGLDGARAASFDPPVCARLAKTR